MVLEAPGLSVAKRVQIGTNLMQKELDVLGVFVPVPDFEVHWVGVKGPECPGSAYASEPLDQPALSDRGHLLQSNVHCAKEPRDEPLRPPADGPEESSGVRHEESAAAFPDGFDAEVVVDAAVGQ